jgi:thermitase
LNGHGTHVAGIAAAVGDNNKGVVGMAWGARVMAVRGLNAQGYGWDSDLAKAVLYAAQNGADVINASWAGFSFNLVTGMQSVLRDAVDTATSRGVVVVAAAGNNAGNADEYEPAGYPNVIAVGATQPVPPDTQASFSNHGNSLSVSAPGVDILSLRSATNTFDPKFYPVVGSNYLRLSGTSMASPHVAGWRVCCCPPNRV